MRKKGSVYHLVRIAVMTALLEAAKFALNSIANVELITLLLMTYTKVFGWKDSLKAALLFAAIETLWWGVSIWTITYFYIWPLLILLEHLLRNCQSRLLHACAAGIFGLLFGLFCSLPTLIMNGWNAAVAWWIAGIPYDLVHGISNFIIDLLLFEPCVKALRRLSASHRTDPETENA